MRIQIETIPHDKQRYETVGDWFYDSNGVLHIKVSQMSDERYATLVAVHELIEVLLCKQHGVTQEQVDKFDINFEKERAFCEASKHEFEGADEPGDDPKAPYKNEHCIAMGIERILAAGLGVDWATYEKELFKLQGYIIMKILVYDHGLNTEAAIKLAEVGHSVGYFSEWREAFPRCVNESVGLGLEGIERVNNFLMAAARADMICCFDTYSRDIVEYFAGLDVAPKHKFVFGAGSAETLEQDRSFLKDILKAAKLPTARYEIIKGVDALIDFLRKPENKNVFVKIDGQFRGDKETFNHETWAKTMAGELGALLMSFGAYSPKVEFMVEWPIDAAFEVGYDGFAFNGDYTDGLIGYESKDKSYAAVFSSYDKMPRQLRLANEATAAVFKASGTPTIYSTELRAKTKDEWYLIDPCVRAPHPPLAAELEHFSNFAKVVTELAQGHWCQPKPTEKYSVAIEVKSDELKEHWCDVTFEPKFRHLVKLQRACMIDGVYYALPGSVVACNVVGLGSTLKAAKAECIKVLDTVKVPGMSYDLDSLDLLEEETIPAGRKFGIEF